MDILTVIKGRRSVRSFKDRTIGASPYRSSQGRPYMGSKRRKPAVAALSLENMMLAAHSLGLGTAWVGAFDEDGAAECLGLSRNLRPVAIVPVGYPLHIPAIPERISKEKAVIEVR